LIASTLQVAVRLVDLLELEAGITDTVAQVVAAAVNVSGPVVLIEVLPRLLSFEADLAVVH